MTSRRCKHRDDGGRISMHWFRAGSGSVCCLVNICSMCGVWLSLGPSNDTPDAVKIEIRAAEIAANYDSGKPPIEWCNIYEWFGFDAPGDSGVYRMSPKRLASRIPRTLHPHARGIMTWMKQDGCEIVITDKAGNETRIADVRMLLVMTRRAVEALDKREGDVAEYCPECGSGNVTVRPADKTFARLRGCLDCNHWIDPVRLVNQ